MHELHEFLGPELYEMHCQWVAWQVMPPRSRAEYAAVAQLAHRWNTAVDGLDIPTPGVR